LWLRTWQTLPQEKCGRTSGKHSPNSDLGSFRTDKRLETFLKSSSFDGPDWQNKVLDDAEWPDGLRPTIRYWPIASLDEVVNSTEWVKRATYRMTENVGC
jgi:hypothetical protein